MTFPYVVLHRNHLAFRTRDIEQPTRKDVIWLGEEPPKDAENFMSCGTCGAAMTTLALAAGIWSVEYAPA